LATQLDIDYATIANNELFSDANLQAYINRAIQRAWDYKPWPFTQKAEALLTTPATDYYDSPGAIMLDSGFRLTVAGKEYKILSMQAYQKYLADNPTGTDRVCAFWESFVFINANAYTPGDEIVFFGKQYAPVLSADADLMPFSLISDNNEHSGNGAIVQLAYAEALESEKKQNPMLRKSVIASTERKDAYDTLDLLWKPFGEFFSNQQQGARAMIDMPDFFAGRNSSSKTIGNFN